ncbi:Subtilisin-like protease SBT1.7 [Hibiscus syriacus]|uniref:Subtilisin-like protease SBT1.7 n=1 Tax=Hibiscus syriacus TaxID=106335 RepID=A0A6A2ZF47_HIBSY|nr:subtilisin-like protease SBT1.6 [Hibiscus syriacus]KAE8690674.1 Subtilisin-like protease SBT1.7 [Hibiscus syriacus]
MATVLSSFVPLLLLLSISSSFWQSFSSDETVKTFIFRVDSQSKPSIFPTHYHWYTSEFAEPTRILHTYDTVFLGFSATLTEAHASSLSDHPSVLAVFEDRRRELHTTRSPQFLGLRNQHGLWSDSNYGSDAIIGVFDTGVWPERRSFSDTNLGPVPARWKGVCQTGARFVAKNCNRKLIGARFFSKGHEAAAGPGVPITGINQTIEFMSPRDADGHGTHTASTAAGRHAFRASMGGYAAGIAKGVAPKARLAVYKVCWKNSGCFDSDILAAFDAAVKDGVDVISISVGGGDGISTPYYLDPIAIGAYGAVSRGVFVSSSAGNDGPNIMSVTNLAPWLVTVGAGTIDRNFPADVVLSDGRSLNGVSLYSGVQLKGNMYPVVYPGKSGELSASLCMENSLDPNVVKGKIVICDRGSNPRVAKGMVVKEAGGVGMILANGASNGEGLVGDAHLLPACALGSDEGDAVKKYVSSSANPTATIDVKGTVIGIKPAPVVASFSARGPNGLNPEILKPDLIAPGVNILAAWTDAVGPTGLDSDPRRTEFNILSGTSMACPHVSGAAALLKSAHPDWSPAAIRSAMMTTASITDNTNRPMIDEATGKPSTPYDFGAGHLNLNRAMDPGLIYDITNSDYEAFLCAIGYNPKLVQVVTRSPAACPMKKPLPENLNYPSIAALFSTTSRGPSSKTFIRTVTNVGQANAVYVAKIAAPRGVTVTVKPMKLVFTPAVKKISFFVTITADSKHLVLDDAGAVFGSLTWTDGKNTHVVRSPIIVTQLDPL